jgi:uncharacterized membrane protein
MRKFMRVAGRALLWMVTVGEAVAIGAPGATKFAGDMWLRLFVGWGYPASFSYVVGALEITGAIGVLIPATASWAAMLLATIMVGAVVTLVTHPGSMTWGTPAVHVALLSCIAAVRWRQRIGSRDGAPNAR